MATKNGEKNFRSVTADYYQVAVHAAPFMPRPALKGPRLATYLQEYLDSVFQATEIKNSVAEAGAMYTKILNCFHKASTNCPNTLKSGITS